MTNHRLNRGELEALIALIESQSRKQGDTPQALLEAHHKLLAKLALLD